MARRINNILVQMLLGARVEAYCRGEISRFQLVLEVINILETHGEEHMIEY